MALLCNLSGTAGNVIFPSQRIFFGTVFFRPKADGSRTHYGFARRLIPHSFTLIFERRQPSCKFVHCYTKNPTAETLRPAKQRNFCFDEVRRAQEYCRISSDEAKSTGKLSFVRRDGFNPRQPIETAGNICISPTVQYMCRN